MEATLALSCDSLADDDLQNLTRQLSLTLNRETDVAAAVPEAPPEPGARGGETMLYTLLLTFMTGPVGLALYLLVRGAWKKRWSVEEAAPTGGVGA